MVFLLFILVVVLLFWVASLSNRLGNLEAKYKKGVAPGVPHETEEVAPRGFLQPKNVPAMAEQVIAMPAPPKDEEVKVPLTEAQQTEIATNWLNKIGVVAVLLGMVFFFKYAIDQGWINPWMRIIIGFLVSGLLVYLGELWKEKYGKRAYGLSGGGIALFYFSIYAGHQFYELMSQPVAWVLMLAVATLSVYLSFRYASLTLGALGFFGAYGSPLMLSSGQNQQVTLFVYLSVMNIVALAICAKKYWAELLYLAFLGTVVDYSVWASNFSVSTNAFISMFFVIVTTALLVLGSIILIRHHRENNSLPETVDNNLSFLYVFVGLFYLITSWFLLGKDLHNFLAPIALLGSVLVFFAYALIDRLEFKNINYSLTFVASSLLVFAAFWQYDGKALVFALLLIALLGTSLGFLLKREELRVWSLIILFMSLFGSLFAPYANSDKVFLFNAKFGLMFANTLAMLFVGWLYGKFTPSKFEESVEGGLKIVAAIILWIAVSWDMSFGLTAQGKSAVQNYMTLWWVVYPAILAVAAFISKRSGLTKLSVILLFASLVKVLFLPYGEGVAFLANAKFGLMLLQTLALFLVSEIYSRSQEKDDTSGALNVVGSLFFWFAVSWEIAQYFSGADSVNTRNLLLSLWWVVYAVILMGVSAFTKKPVFRKVALGLFTLSILKVFLYDVQALDTGYRIVAFIVLGIILLSVSFAYNRNKEKIVNFIEGENKQS